MTTQQHDPFAPSESRPSVSFKNMPVGTTYHLEVTDLPKLVQARNFETRELETWPDGNPKMTVVTNVVDKQTGEEKSLWAPKPSSMFQAIVDAQQAAGAQIAVGGTLVVSFTHEVPNKDNPRLNPAKQYAVRYEPPNAFASAPEWAQPQQTQQVPAAMPQQWGQPGQGMLPPMPQQAYVTHATQQMPPVQAPLPVGSSFGGGDQANAPTAAPAPALNSQPGPTPEAIAALRAAGVDPATVYPGWQG